MKRFAVFFIAVVFIGTFLWWQSLPKELVDVTVPPGASARDVAVLLKRSGVIMSSDFFLWALHFSGKAKSIKAGTYRFSPRLTSFGIVKLLVEGRVRGMKVTIPEGFTARQVAERLAQLHIVNPENFMRVVEERKLEGYLYPETYFFETNLPESRVADAMVREFSRRFTPDLSARSKELSMSEHQAVTLASIIEKEAMRSEERPLIAGVFHNRLKKRWYLESCATVLYSLGEHKQKLTLKDLKIDSPYNTYRRRGLPPGPICNPGIASIKAALYPADTEDMFFVTQGSGTHAFSRYFNEHVKNKKVLKKKKRSATANTR